MNKIILIIGVIGSVCSILAIFLTNFTYGIMTLLISLGLVGAVFVYKFVRALFVPFLTTKDKIVDKLPKNPTYQDIYIISSGSETYHQLIQHLFLTRES